MFFVFLRQIDGRRVGNLPRSISTTKRIPLLHHHTTAHQHLLFDCVSRAPTVSKVPRDCEKIVIRSFMRHAMRTIFIMRIIFPDCEACGSFF